MITYRRSTNNASHYYSVQAQGSSRRYIRSWDYENTVERHERKNSHLQRTHAPFMKQHKFFTLTSSELNFQDDKIVQKILLFYTKQNLSFHLTIVPKKSNTQHRIKAILIPIRNFYSVVYGHHVVQGLIMLGGREGAAVTDNVRADYRVAW